MNILTALTISKSSNIPPLDSEVVLSYIVGKSREYLLAHPEKKLSIFESIRYRVALSKIKKGIPVSYITGHKEFFGIDFVVNRHTLIPRPETEILVEEVLQYAKTIPPTTIVDIGVGSGAILLSIMKSLDNTMQYIGIDISKKALEVAKLNAKNHNLLQNCTFLHGNLLSPLQTTSAPILITNPPYLTDNEMDEPSIQFEPKSALYGGADGLKYYEELFSQINEFNISPQAIFLEIGYQQAEKISELVKKNLSGYTISVIKDLCGHDRVLKILK